MKNISKILIIILLLAVQSCKFKDTNVDPDNPTDAPAQSLFPAAQGYMAYALGGDAARYSGIFTQYFTGTANQHYSFTQYQLATKDVNTFWNQFYSKALPCLNGTISKSEEEGSPHYAGVGKILKALWLGSVTDLYGDVPYSEADKGAEILSPKYEKQEFLYTEIDKLFEDGISDIEASKSVKSPGAEDFIYQGDLEKWKKLAYVLRARYALHLSKKGEDGAAKRAIEFLKKGAFESNGDDADFHFIATQGNPLSQFEKGSRSGDIRTCEYIVELLKKNNDPRLPLFIGKTKDGEFLGSPITLDEINANASPVGPYFGEATTPYTFISFSEMNFILAEALVIANGANSAEANEAYLKGVRASLEKVGVAADKVEEYLKDKTLSGSKEENVAQIITEKYVSLFNHFESFNDYRRTGYPSLESATGNKEDMARRFPYALDEYNYNTNTPKSKITDDVWWAK